MKKQSSVEWFASRLLSELGLTIEDTKTDNPKLYDLIQQAKEMEKQFIIDAFMAGAEIGEMHNNENRKFYIDAKEYYKNTYEKEN